MSDLMSEQQLREYIRAELALTRLDEGVIDNLQLALDVCGLSAEWVGGLLGGTLGFVGGAAAGGGVGSAATAPAGTAAGTPLGVVIGSGVGATCDVVSGMIDLAHGRYFMASLSFLGAIPGAGTMFNSSKLFIKASRLVRAPLKAILGQKLAVKAIQAAKRAIRAAGKITSKIEKAIGPEVFKLISSIQSLDLTRRLIDRTQFLNIDDQTLVKGVALAAMLTGKFKDEAEAVAYAQQLLQVQSAVEDKREPFERLMAQLREGAQAMKQPALIANLDRMEADFGDFLADLTAVVELGLELGDELDDFEDELEDSDTVTYDTDTDDDAAWYSDTDGDGFGDSSAASGSQGRARSLSDLFYGAAGISTDAFGAGKAPASGFKSKMGLSSALSRPSKQS